MIRTVPSLTRIWRRQSSGDFRGDGVNIIVLGTFSAKQGIGFVGYAHKDPRTEYKREGRRAFLAMWDRIAEQVTQAVFRIEHESPAFVGSLWRISATEHDVAAPLPLENKVDELQTNAPEAGEDGKTIAPIVNNSPRIGRNDDCPCGSGKKYKKCCGK